MGSIYRKVFGDDPKKIVLLVSLTLGFWKIISELLYWGEFGEAVSYFIVNIPLAITLLVVSTKILYEERKRNDYILARIGTVLALLLFIPKIYFYYKYGWAIGLLD